jgi:hypothetical protein
MHRLHAAQSHFYFTWLFFLCLLAHLHKHPRCLKPRLGEVNVRQPVLILAWLEMLATCWQHVSDKAKCRQFLSRQANFGDMVYSVSAHFVLLFPDMYISTLRCRCLHRRGAAAAYTAAALLLPPLPRSCQAAAAAAKLAAASKVLPLRFRRRRCLHFHRHCCFCHRCHFRRCFPLFF